MNFINVCTFYPRSTLLSIVFFVFYVHENDDDDNDDDDVCVFDSGRNSNKTLNLEEFRATSPG